MTGHKVGFPGRIRHATIPGITHPPPPSNVIVTERKGTYSIEQEGIFTAGCTLAR